MKVQVIPPPADLRRDVECFRVSAHHHKQGLAIHVVPKAVPGIVFQHQEGRSAMASIITPSRLVRPPVLFLHGVVTEPSVMNYTAGTYTTIQVILKPHALQSLFGLNAGALARHPVPLDELSNANLTTRMIEAGDTSERLVWLTELLRVQLAKARGRDLLVEGALRTIHANVAAVTVHDLLRECGVSERQFERRFSQSVGVPARSYIRVARLNEAIRLIKTERYERLTDVAHAMGYYDQSHFIRDVKALAGVTPKVISASAAGAFHNQLGYSYLDE
jgi:AraC-like DNA-binding protein